MEEWFSYDGKWYIYIFLKKAERKAKHGIVSIAWRCAETSKEIERNRDRGRPRPAPKRSWQNLTCFLSIVSKRPGLSARCFRKGTDGRTSYAKCAPSRQWRELRAPTRCPAPTPAQAGRPPGRGKSPTQGPALPRVFPHTSAYAARLTSFLRPPRRRKS